MMLMYKKRQTKRRVVKKLKPATKKYVKKAIQAQQELKTSYSVATDGSLDLEGTIYHISSVAQGDLQTNRSGNVINGKTVELRCTLSNANAAADAPAPTRIRVILFKDRQQNAAAPTIANLLRDPTDGERTINSSINHATFPKRFKVYYDRVHTFNYGNTGGSNGIVSKNIKLYVKVPGKIIYSGANATDIVNNQIYAFFVTAVDEIGAFTATGTINYTDS